MMEVQTNIIEYLPEFLREIREYEALATVENSEFKKIWKEIEEAFNNQTIDTANEYGIKRMEKILNIVPTKDDINERKIEIKTHLRQQLPYTSLTLKNAIDEFCIPRKFENNTVLDGYFLEINPNECTLNLKISLWNKDKEKLIKDMVRQICPANIFCDIGLKYNTYEDIKKIKFTYSKLKKLTYKQLREDVLEDIVYRTYGDLKSLMYDKLCNYSHQKISVDNNKLL